MSGIEGRNFLSPRPGMKKRKPDFSIAKLSFYLVPHFIKYKELNLNLGNLS